MVPCLTHGHVTAKKRMLRMVPDKAGFEEMVKKRRQAEYEREKAAHEQRAKADAERRRREREEQTRKQREERERQEQEEEEKRVRQEEERKRREEEVLPSCPPRTHDEIPCHLQAVPICERTCGTP